MAKYKPLKRDMERALLVIEGIVFHAADDSTSGLGIVPLGFSVEGYISCLQNMVADCYMISHAASGHCCAGGNGDPWLKLIDQRAKELKKAKTIDVDKALRRKK